MNNVSCLFAVLKGCQLFVYIFHGMSAVCFHFSTAIKSIIIFINGLNVSCLFTFPETYHCCKVRLFEWFLNIVKVLLMRIIPYIFLFFKVSRKSAREEEMKVQRTLTWGRTQAFNFETFAVTLMQISTKAAFSNDFFLCRLVLRRVVHLVLENIMSKCIQVSFKNRLCTEVFRYKAL